MAPSIAAEGKLSISALDTPYDLTTQTTAGVYQLYLDLYDEAMTDVLMVRIYKKVNSTGTLRLYMERPYVNPQGEPAKGSTPVAIGPGGEVKFSVEQTDGTPLGTDSLPWEVLKLS